MPKILLCCIDHPDELICTYFRFGSDIFDRIRLISTFDEEEYLKYHIMLVGKGRIEYYPKHMEYNFEDAITAYKVTHRPDWDHELYEEIYVIKNNIWLQCSSSSPMLLTEFVSP